MTLKEKTRPSRRTSTTAVGLGQWLMVGAILVGLALLVIRVADVVGDNQDTAAGSSSIQDALDQTRLNHTEFESGISGRTAPAWTVDDELAAIRNSARTAQVQGSSPAPAWTLENEVAAIRNNVGTAKGPNVNAATGFTLPDIEIPPVPKDESTAEIGGNGEPVTRQSGLGIWQTQPATDQAPSVVQTVDFSAEAVRIRNLAKVHEPAALGPGLAPSVEQTVDFSAEAVQIRNLAKVHDSAALGSGQDTP
jgi:hypothetical protein